MDFMALALRAWVVLLAFHFQSHLLGNDSFTLDVGSTAERLFVDVQSQF